EFLNSLNQFDAFITARYHGAILGSLLNKPTIAIEIEPKLRILTEQIPEILLWSKPFQIENLKSLVSRLNYHVDYSQSNKILIDLSDKMLLEFKNQIIKK